MCQGKKEGGRRCAIHMKGSNAACLHAERSTGANKKEVKEAFKDLRREGKELELPAPPPEVVRAFAEMQRFSANFDPELTEHDRKIIGNAWNRTSNAVEQGETPDGATFHAWQNLRSEVMRRLAMQKSRLMAIGISGALSLGMTACSYAGGADFTPEPSHTPIVTAPVSPTPAPEPSPASQYDAYGIGATGPLQTDVHGQWRQAQLSEDAPAAQFDKNKYGETVWESYTEEEVAEAQKLMAEFLVTHYLDGVSAFDSSEAARQAQLDNTIDFVSDEWHEAWTEDVLGNDPSAAVNPASTVVTSRGYEPAPYSAENLRFETKNFTFKEGYRTKDEGLLALHFTAEYQHSITKDGKEYTVSATTLYRSVVVKEEGEWKLTGWGLDGGFTVRDADGNVVK